MKNDIIDTKCKEAVRNAVFLIKTKCPKELCDTTIASEVKTNKEGKYVPSLKKDFQCSTLTQTVFDHSIQDVPECRVATVNKPFPPCEIPDDVVNMFLYDGRASHTFLGMIERKKQDLTKLLAVWSKDWIEQAKAKFRLGQLEGAYGSSAVKLIRATIESHLTGQVRNSSVQIGHTFIIIFCR